MPISTLDIINTQIHGVIDNQREVSRRSTVPCVYHSAHTLDVIESYLAAYTVAGGDLEELPAGPRLAECLAGMIVWLCDLEFFDGVGVDETMMDSIHEVVNRVHAITESLDESGYGLAVTERFNWFATDLGSDDMELESAYAPAID